MDIDTLSLIGLLQYFSRLRCYLHIFFETLERIATEICDVVFFAARGDGTLHILFISHSTRRYAKRLKRRSMELNSQKNFFFSVRIYISWTHGRKCLYHPALTLPGSLVLRIKPRGKPLLEYGTETGMLQCN